MQCRLALFGNNMIGTVSLNQLLHQQRETLETRLCVSFSPLLRKLLAKSFQYAIDTAEQRVEINKMQ